MSSTLDNLTLRTANALSRFAELERRAATVADKRSIITQKALAELSTALEELQVANDELHRQLGQLKAMRESLVNTRQNAEGLSQAIPMATLWTDRVGVIETANDAACQLLNVGKQHLAGKSMLLFIDDRAALFAALRTLYEGEHAGAVDVDVTVRPRERHPRKMNLAGRRLPHDERCVWFFDKIEVTDQKELARALSNRLRAV